MSLNNVAGGTYGTSACHSVWRVGFVSLNCGSLEVIHTSEALQESDRHLQEDTCVSLLPKRELSWLTVNDAPNFSLVDGGEVNPMFAPYGFRTACSFLAPQDWVLCSQYIVRWAVGLGLEVCCPVIWILAGDEPAETVVQRSHWGDPAQWNLHLQVSWITSRAVPRPFPWVWQLLAVWWFWYMACKVWKMSGFYSWCKWREE